jgi:hypothetical protein
MTKPKRKPHKKALLASTASYTPPPAPPPPAPPFDPTAASDRMTRIQAAAFLTAIGFPISVKTLAQRACGRGYSQGPPGPPYQSFLNRVIYEKNDLIVWAESQLSPKARTTSEHQDLARQAEIAGQHAA